jgi:YVTN family beta-propeller protein
MRTLFLVFFVLSLCPLCLCGESPEPHRSPIDLALLPGGRLLTANHTADTVTLVDVATGKVLAEAASGRKPAAVACTADGKHAAVSNLWSDTVALFDVGDAALKPAGEVIVGTYPRGLVYARDGRTLYVALAGADEVAEVDVASRTVTHRWPAPREPRRVVLSADGRFLAAASTRSARVRVWETATRKLHWERTVEDAFNLRGLVFAPDGRSLICSHVVRRDFPVSKSNIEEGWVIDSRLTRLPLDADAKPPLEQIALDTRGRAVGDPEGLAFDPEGKYLALAGSGTQELLLLEAKAIPWSAGDPGDLIDRRLTVKDRLRRFDLGGRPLALAFLPGGEAVVANYLRDAVQVVEVPSGKVARTIHLGGPVKPDPARQGEALFHDARRSHNHWFSCHTCHTDGHTCGLNFDTLNDDSYGKP